ncbi:MAG: RNA-guided pseudouridylation complex pseudouridine synthase subunit Cbf5 [Candidatus Pacearchaeota archaeon]|nr:RNA-guided pseudouridylation complex pseudouridine synthase subunit Cbf5 [Candidatus Pacearchaeota archaeon]
MENRTIQELLEFGIINLDKPNNYTSFQAAEIAGRILGLRKFSHFGTLDPKVTGVLPIALNRACKLTGWFMKKNKTYVGVMKIHKPIEEAKLKQEMAKFVGKIMQMPPVKSRVKRQERQREVYSWDILEIDSSKNQVLFSCEVEAGTYIRKLISDLGDKIGGSHMLELRRTKAGIFSENDKNFIDMYNLEKIKDDEEKLREIIIPADEAIRKILPTVFVKKEAEKNLLTGKPIFSDDLEGKEFDKLEDKAEFAVFSDRFIGIYKKVNEGEILALSLWVRN